MKRANLHLAYCFIAVNLLCIAPEFKLLQLLYLPVLHFLQYLLSISQEYDVSIPRRFRHRFSEIVFCIDLLAWMTLVACKQRCADCFGCTNVNEGTNTYFGVETFKYLFLLLTLIFDITEIVSTSDNAQPPNAEIQ